MYMLPRVNGVLSVTYMMCLRRVKKDEDDDVIPVAAAGCVDTAVIPRYHISQIFQKMRQ